MYSLIIAFAMYSKIPMPKVEWTKENMKYTMCYFPLIGVVIGILYAFVYTVWDILPFQNVLKNVLLSILPIVVTGGIHLDGFIDTIDARHSYQSRERKLEILKDPHVGAFAVIWTIVYFGVLYGLTYEVTEKTIWIVAIIFVFSRTLSGLGVVSIKAAKKDGLLVSFSSTAHSKRVRIVLFIEMLLCIVAMMAVHVVAGGICAITGIVVFFCYRRMALREFDGITGDLAGYFLQCCELAILFVAAVCGKYF